MSLESCSATCDDMARQLLIFGRRIPPAEIVERINAVDREAIRRVGARLLEGNRPTLTALGPLGHLPGLDEVRARLH